MIKINANDTKKIRTHFLDTAEVYKCLLTNLDKSISACADFEITDPQGMREYAKDLLKKTINCCYRMCDIIKEGDIEISEHEADTVATILRNELFSNSQRPDVPLTDEQQALFDDLPAETLERDKNLNQELTEMIKVLMIGSDC